MNLKIFSVLILLYLASCGLPEIEYIGSPDVYESTTILTTEQLAFNWNDDISSNVILQGFNVYYKFYNDINVYISDKDRLGDNTSLSYLINTLGYKITSMQSEQDVPVIEISDPDTSEIFMLNFNDIVTESIDAQLIFYFDYNTVNQTQINLYRNIISNSSSDEYASFSDINVSSYSDLSSFSDLLSTDLLMISIAVSSVGISETDFSQIISEPVILGIIQNIPVN